MGESIRQLDRKSCTGCGSCAAVCPNQAIQDKSISEGFDYPFVDGYLCDHCGKCSSHCPELAKENVEKKEMGEYLVKRYAFAAQDDIRWNCEDGGGKQAVMSYILENGGKVCVPVFVENFRGTAYEILDNPEKLEHRTLVQYVECDGAEIFPRVKETLDKEELLLFLGTPCQNAGLKYYLGKEYENLLLGDMICRGVTSQTAWAEYLDLISGGEPIREVRFGAKELGWRESIRLKIDADETRVYDGAEKDIFLQAYQRGLSLRKCCFTCAYREPQGDLGFDIFYDVKKYKSSLDDKKGMSYLAVYTPKAEKVAEGIWKNAKIFERVEKAILERRLDIKCSEKQRQVFWEYWETHGWRDILRHVDNTFEKKPVAPVYALDYHVGDTAKWEICNPLVWQRRIFDGYDVLLPDGNTGNSWILMSLAYVLDTNVKYEFDIRFKAQTKARYVRMLLTDKVPDGGNRASIIEIWGQNIPNNTWMRVRGNYVPKRTGLKYFYVTSTDFLGEESYVCFDWIRIFEK